MNVEVLNAICLSVRDELSKTNIPNLLSQLSNHMQNMVNQPQAPQHQQNVSQTKALLISELRKSKTNDFSPFWKENIKEIGFEGLLGNQLADVIEEVFAKNQITVSEAHKEIVNIFQKMSSMVTCITQLTSNLEKLNIGSEKLSRGQSVFEILIPRLAIDQNLKQFSDEIIELKKVIDDFNELITGSRPEIKLKTIASSDYNLVLEILPKVGLALLEAISLIATTYLSILEIKRHLKGLKEQGMPDENLKGIDDYANSQMANSISKGVDELIKKFAGKMDNGRKNELSISINFSMNKLSNRIDSGYNFDVRFSEEKVDEKMNEKEEQEAREQIQNMSRNLEFMNLTGERILQLPERNDKPDEN